MSRPVRLPRPRRENRPSYLSLAAGGTGVVAVVLTAVLLAPSAPAGTPVSTGAPELIAAGLPTVPAVKPVPHKAKPAATAAPSSSTRAPRPQQAPAQQPAGTVRLAAGGTATLQRVDVGPDGVLPIPPGIGIATWWGSELDDRSGATVVAGHVNWHGQTGPFAELWRAQVGDPVTIGGAGGRVLRFRVVQLVTLGKNELPQRAGELFSQIGPHRLVLVTCGGQWVGGEIGYASNRVVIAEPGR